MQPMAVIANAAISAAATVRTASVLVLLFVLIGGAFHGLVRKRGSATASLADAIAGIARGSFRGFGPKPPVDRLPVNELAPPALGV